MLVEAAEVPAWLAALASRVAAAPNTQLDAYPTSTPRARQRRPVLLAAYEWVDRKLFRCRPDALARVRIEVKPAAPRSFEGYDVVLDFASEDPWARAAGVRFGVWTFANELDGGLPRERVHGFRIEAHFADGSRVLVHSSTGAVDPASLSRTRNRSLWKAQAAFAARLETVRRLDTAFLDSRPEATVGGRVFRTTSYAIAKRATAAGLGVVGRHIRATRRGEAWFVATRPRREITTSDGFEPLELARPGAADPFVLEEDGATYLFFEDDDPHTGRAHISYVVLDAEGRAATAARTALAAPYHLSYPFVFRHEGEILMIPESSANGTVELYRACPFPSRWELAHVLLRDVRAFDPTLHVERDHFWLFVCLAQPGASPNDDLHLFSSSSLVGPWEPHPLNPIVSDARSARPAGRLFRQGEELIRPAQDCSRRYGFAVVFNRVDVLDDNAYGETPVGRIEPTWHPDVVATHTYNFGSAVEVVDGKRAVRKRRIC
jgi:hypothetical protein